MRTAGNLDLIQDHRLQTLTLISFIDIAVLSLTQRNTPVQLDTVRLPNLPLKNLSCGESKTGHASNYFQFLFRIHCCITSCFPPFITIHHNSSHLPLSLGNLPDSPAFQAKCDHHISPGTVVVAMQTAPMERAIPAEKHSTPGCPGLATLGSRVTIAY